MTYNKSYTAMERPRIDLDFDPRPDGQSCSKCSRHAKYIYKGEPRCEEHIPKQAKEAATEV